MCNTLRTSHSVFDQRLHQISHYDSHCLFSKTGLTQSCACEGNFSFRRREAVGIKSSKCNLEDFSSTRVQLQSRRICVPNFACFYLSQVFRQHTFDTTVLQCAPDMFSRQLQIAFSDELASCSSLTFISQKSAVFTVSSVHLLINSVILCLFVCLGSCSSFGTRFFLRTLERLTKTRTKNSHSSNNSAEAHLEALQNRHLRLSDIEYAKNTGALPSHVSLDTDSSHAEHPTDIRFLYLIFRPERNWASMLQVMDN